MLNINALTLAHLEEVVRIGFGRAAFLGSSTIAVMSALNGVCFATHDGESAESPDPSSFHRTPGSHGPSLGHELIRPGRCIVFFVESEHGIDVQSRVCIGSDGDDGDSGDRGGRALTGLGLRVDRLAFPLADSLTVFGGTASFAFSAWRLATGRQIEAASDEFLRILEAGNHWALGEAASDEGARAEWAKGATVGGIGALV